MARLPILNAPGECSWVSVNELVSAVDQTSSDPGGEVASERPAEAERSKIWTKDEKAKPVLQGKIVG